jgi:DNA polymerase-3 subunit gamma/tau
LRRLKAKPSTQVLLEVGNRLKKCTVKKMHQDFLLKGITIANDCDLKFKLSQNQRLLVELCLMQLASITFDGEKKNAFIIPPTFFQNDYSIADKTKATEQIAVKLFL